MAKFGDPPPAAGKAASAENIALPERISEEKGAPFAKAADTTRSLPEEPAPARSKKIYDFTVRDVKNVPPGYVPDGSVDTTHAITAVNHGMAPVSVVLDIDRDRSDNLRIDGEGPLYAVVPPNSEQVLFRARPEQRGSSYRARYSYSWGIGVYTAKHSCPERYRFPFGGKVKAFASLAEGEQPPPDRFAITFSMPAGTTVLAARKGVISRIKENHTIDILHDDSTIATYQHIGRIGAEISEGKVVSAGDPLGVLSPMGKSGDSYLHFVVWRPEPQHFDGAAPQNSSLGFSSVSFPVEFCTDTGTCSVLTKNQPVPFVPAAKAKSRGRGKS
ncbi:M23 family metallopeptidase [Geomonas nitrogeniifigens]|uniref:M23 family metallopeptidase n=1 Tax=Geomonas diazotrophica TaxID=2843197 RepID=UPI001C2B88E0|nr:M23 family metallopeptidase [Geomonas nitrogeniifigens]QXE87670.1 M23 family metallopeptidase [Geomonas nitrogeniifigens]